MCVGGSPETLDNGCGCVPFASWQPTSLDSVRRHLQIISREERRQVSLIPYIGRKRHLLIWRKQLTFPKNVNNTEACRGWPPGRRPWAFTWHLYWKWAPKQNTIVERHIWDISMELAMGMHLNKRVGHRCPQVDTITTPAVNQQPYCDWGADWLRQGSNVELELQDELLLGLINSSWRIKRVTAWAVPGFTAVARFSTQTMKEAEWFTMS